MKKVIEQKDLFQNIFEASIQGIATINEEGDISFANPACEQLFGYEPGELIGKNIEIFIPENLGQNRKIQIKIQKKTSKRETDVWGIKKDGTKFDLNIDLNPTIIDGNYATIIFFRDDSQHNTDLRTIKQTNAELLESNRKYDALINNQKGIVFRSKFKKNYEMEFISQGCFEITGYPLEAFKKGNINYGQLILEEDRDSVWEEIQNVVKPKETYSVEYRLTHKDGSIKYVWERGKAVFNDQNEVEALEGFISDITPQKEAELDLRRSETKIKALLEANPDRMFIQDRKGVYLDWYANNPDKLFFPPEKFMGLNMKKVLPPNVYQKIKASHNKVIKSGEIQIAEYSVLNKNNVEHYEARVVLMNHHKLLTIVRDVTEEKATDAQLNIKNNALTSASNSIVIADAQQPNIPIIYCNEAFEKMTGYSQEEILGKDSQFLLNDDRDQKEIEIIENAISNGETCNVIVRNYRKDGSMFWNDTTITPIYNEENKLTHFIGVNNDVSKKVKEEKLKDQTRKILEMITQSQPIESIGDTIVETVETHLEDCTASILLLDNKDKTLHNLVAPNLPKAFSDHIEGITIGPQQGSFGTASFLKKEVIVSNIETSVLWENHKEVALKNGLKACWSFPIMSSTGQVLGTFNVYSPYPRKPENEEKEIILNLSHLASVAIESHNNIIALGENKRQLEIHSKKLEENVQERTQEVMATVQKLVETNLNLEDQLLITERIQKVALASKTLASKIAKYFPKGLIVVINKNLEVEFVEGEALDLLDLRQTLKEGMSIDDVTFLSEPRKALIKENILKTLSGKHLSFDIKYKKGYFNINTAPLMDENNEIVSALHVYNDISKQKEIEFRIKNAFKNEQKLNELKSRFVSMASHEFRTPLTSILISAILIGKQNEPGKEYKRMRYVTQIERNVNNLNIILNDFLSLEELEGGKVVPKPERFDLISFSKLLVKETNVSLKKKQTINVTSTQEELFVFLDIKLLSHILNNLLSNASKYSPEATCIDFKISQKNENVVIQITDQGIGIPKEEHHLLFSRFFRANNVTNIEGTGLGLNIVKQYIELMGGNIQFKSRINRGATFLVKFPKHTI